jgi:tetratricopeptide (TPR) repeat protein
MSGDDAAHLALCSPCDVPSRALRAAAEGHLCAARIGEALRLLESDAASLAASESSPEERVRLTLQHATVLRYAGAPNNDRAPLDVALALLDAIEPAARALGDLCLLADMLHMRGVLLYDKEVWVTDLAPALACFEESLALRRAAGDSRGVAESLFYVGTVLQNRIGAGPDSTQAAFEHFERAYRLAVEGGFEAERGHAARHLGYLWTERGDFTRALAYHLEYLSTNEALGFRPALPPACCMAGFAYLMTGRADEAGRCFEAARAIAAEAGFSRYLAEALYGLGATAERRGETAAAADYYGQAARLAGSIGFAKVTDVASARVEALRGVAGSESPAAG